MRLIRAHDGRAITVNQPLSQFHSLEELLDCFSLATEIPSDAIICMTADGSQLKDELIQQIIEHEEQQHQIALSQDQSRTPPSASDGIATEFFVFNREFLFADPDVVAAELAESPVLEPGLFPLEIAHPPTPKSLEALVIWSDQVVAHLVVHERYSHELLDHIRSINRSTQVALFNLQSHADSIKKGADALADLAGKELSRMQGLLDGHERDLQILAMVAINPRLLSGSSSADGRSRTSKERTLGDYVSRVKMTAVADACSKVYTELRERITELEQSIDHLNQDTSGLTNEVQGTSIDPSCDTYQEVSQAVFRSKDLRAYVEDNCSPDPQGWPVADKLQPETYEQVVAASDELLLLDEVGRQSVVRLTQDRNDMMARSLHLLQDISSLQSEYADLGTALAAVDADLHSNKLDGFKHLNRLKNMLWAYGATVIEVVRRREFSRHFLGKSQSLAELMAKFSASERKRRHEYRNHIFGQLPWEVKGMEEMAPSLEITTTRTNGEGVADLGRDDLEALLCLLDQVDSSLAETAREGDPPSPIPELKAALQQLAAVLNDMDAEFEHLVNTQLLGQEDAEGSDEDESGSDTSIRARRRMRNRKRLMGADNAQVESLQKQLEEERAQHRRKERELADQQQGELDKLRSEMEQLRRDLSAERLRNGSLTREKDEVSARVDSVTTDLNTERERRLNMADELAGLRADLEEARKAEADARREAHEEADRANEMEAHLHEMQIELDEAKAARIDASNRIEALLSEGSSAEQELHAAQSRIDELTEQVSAAHAEMNKAREAIAEVEASKERQIRSHRAEADGDRAILEEKLRALQRDLDSQNSRAQRAEEARVPDKEAIELLRGQLRAADDAHEQIVREMDQARELADRSEASRRETEASRRLLLERTRPLLSKSYLLLKAIRAMPALSSSKNAASASSAAKAIAASSLTSSAISETERQAALDAFETDMDAADLEVVLDALRVFDATEMHDEIKGKLDSLTTLIRKWQKAYKSSKEKENKATAAAKEKIAFRNFQTGDLALFLPTRNSTAKPWAAFNISFPHYFLRATGQLAEQLKTKEWIVAKITTITDKVATDAPTEDGQDGNPFQLPEGVRYYLLDVETWNSAASVAPPSLRTRRSSSATGVTNGDSGEGRKERSREKRRSDTLPSSATAPTAKDGKTAEEGVVNGEEAAEVQRQAPARRASEGDRPSAPTALTSIQEANRPERRSPTPPMLTPEASPPNRTPAGDRTLGSTLLSPAASSERRTLRSTAIISPDDANASVVSDSAATPTPSGSAPSALTRALRATSPISTRYDRMGGRGWPTASHLGVLAETRTPDERDAVSAYGDSVNGNGDGSTSSKRSAIIERAAVAPAFGRKRRQAQLEEPSSDAGKERRAGLGLGSAPASHTRTSGLGIPSVASQMGEALMSNPFSQSPGPSSMPERELFGGRRRSTLNVSSTGDGKDDEVTPVLTKPAARAAPKVERWEDRAPEMSTRRAASSASGGTRRTPSMVIINGSSLLLADRSAGAVADALAATATDAVVPSSFKSTGSSNHSGVQLTTALGETHVGSPTAASAGAGAGAGAGTLPRSESGSTSFLSRFGTPQRSKRRERPPIPASIDDSTSGASDMLRRLNQPASK